MACPAFRGLAFQQDSGNFATLFRMCHNLKADADDKQLVPQPLIDPVCESAKV
jgi:hypothetical protein